jgi:hypothetical protein
MKKDFVIEFKDVEITAVNAGVVTGKLQQMAGRVGSTKRLQPRQTRLGA